MANNDKEVKQIVNEMFMDKLIHLLTSMLNEYYTAEQFFKKAEERFNKIRAMIEKLKGSVVEDTDAMVKILDKKLEKKI